MPGGNTGPQRSDYARMVCPVEGCMHARGGAPTEGTVPGIKRHVLRVHGQRLYDAVEKWPPIHRNSTSPWGDRIRASKVNPPKPFEEMNIHELRAAAKRRGIPQRNKNKPDFIKALKSAWEDDVESGKTGLGLEGS